MGNKPIEKVAVPQLSEKELLQRQHKKAVREKIISRTRAAVVRSQLVRAYETLEGIRFDYISDTAFRDKVSAAKSAIESAIDDYLMSDKYWEKRVDDWQKMTPEEYEQYLNQPTISSSA